jgi:hypothetical protein
MFTEITLAKALKIKNRLTGRISSLENDIRTYNSVIEGKEDQVNIENLYKIYLNHKEMLIALKSAIYEGNIGIQRSIFEQAEKKGLISFLNSVSTRHGSEHVHSLAHSTLNYVATLRKNDIDSTTKKLEKEVDELQDKIDNYNYTQKIKIDTKFVEF